MTRRQNGLNRHASEARGNAFSNASLDLSFMGVDVRIQSDLPACVEAMERNYQRFAVGKTLPEIPIIGAGPGGKLGNRGRASLSILGKNVWSISNPAVLEAGYIEEMILSAILARIQGYFMIHAGVVLRNGQGIILAADSGHGKTTLVLELIRRGCKFLSDEVAVIGFKDHQVHPFPRALMVKRRSLELTGYSRLARERSDWPGKLPLDIEEIQPGSLATATPVRHVVILQAPAKSGLDPSDDSEREVSVLLDRVDDTFLDSVQRIQHVSGLRVESSNGFPLLKFGTKETTTTLSRIEVLCESRGIWILDILKKPRTQVSFTQPARLECIPKSQAVLELLRRFQGGYKSDLLRDTCGGSATRLFRELAATIRDAECYQLFVGPLPQMADLVCSLVSADEPETCDSIAG